MVHLPLCQHDPHIVSPHNMSSSKLTNLCRLLCVVSPQNVDCSVLLLLYVVVFICHCTTTITDQQQLYTVTTSTTTTTTTTTTTMIQSNVHTIQQCWTTDICPTLQCMTYLSNNLTWYMSKCTCIAVLSVEELLATICPILRMYDFLPVQEHWHEMSILHNV